MIVPEVNFQLWFMPTKRPRMVHDGLLHKGYELNKAILTIHNVVYDTGNMF
jgi:hypothetical protein